MATKKTYTLPDTLKDIDHLILKKAGENGPEGFTFSDVKNLMDRPTSSFHSRLKNLEQENILSTKILRGPGITGSGKKIYTLTELGQHIVKNLEKIPVVETKRLQYKKRNQPKANTQNDIEPIQDPLDLSSEADVFVDMTSRLVEQNHRYRKAIYEVGNLCAKYLGMELVKVDNSNAEEI